jgi:hypothetical protein
LSPQAGETCLLCPLRRLRCEPCQRKSRPRAALRKFHSGALTGSLLRGGQPLLRLFGRGGVLLALLEDQRIAFDRDLAQEVHHGAGAGRDQAADDDVLLQPVEGVGLAVEGGLGK